MSIYYLANKCPIFRCNECFTNVLQAPEWTEEDLSQLTRSMVKFPGGTPGRWEKIAHELGRSVADVSSLRFALCRGWQTRTRQAVEKADVYGGRHCLLREATILLGPGSKPLTNYARSRCQPVSPSTINSCNWSAGWGILVLTNFSYCNPLTEKQCTAGFGATPFTASECWCDLVKDYISVSSQSLKKCTWSNGV